MITRRKMLQATALGCLTGCGKSSTNQEIVEYNGSKFLLDTEPSGAVGVADAKAAVGQQEEIVLIGRIQGGELEPWSRDRAAFFVSEASALLEMDEDEHQHEAGHDHANCPFCNRNKSQGESQAIVQFLDDQGKVLPVDARKLLPVEEGQLVVVQGRGQIDDLGTLVIAAKGIYVRR